MYSKVSVMNKSHVQNNGTVHTYLVEKAIFKCPKNKIGFWTYH